jgi:hypothetical protein
MQELLPAGAYLGLQLSAKLAELSTGSQPTALSSGYSIHLRILARLLLLPPLNAGRELLNRLASALPPTATAEGPTPMQETVPKVRLLSLESLKV